MRKIMVLSVAAILMVIPGCKRQDIEEPDYNTKFTDVYTLNMNADPATIIAYKNSRDKIEVTVELTDAHGNPVASREVWLYITGAGGYQENFGYFSGSLHADVIKETNSGGIINITYYGPKSNEYDYPAFEINALLLESDHQQRSNESLVDQRTSIRVIYEN